ncbi:helix-turn-helix domain-containing protein [Nocardioides flavescens]|uniref:helix-turn-helix domain-containing protein n=1 Tax=Nocardioides flavescens TaxID=2691959 RepID=UPI00301BE828
MTAGTNRDELARVLRRARARVRPEDVGLPVGLRRRVDGLRREELALLAGVSVDYVVRLEQGRGPHPSAQVLGALARALRLESDERDLLFRLAGAEPPRPGTIDVHVRPSVLRLVDRFADLPAMVLSAKGDVIAWNPLASALLGDWSAVAPHRRNHPRLTFLPEPGDRRTPLGGPPEDLERAERNVVAQLRGALSRYPTDTGLARLLDDLATGSERFRELWDEGSATTWRTHTKTLAHPVVGDVTLECDVLVVPDADQTLHVYSAAPGTPAAEQLALLSVVGTQQLTEQVTRQPATGRG